MKIQNEIYKILNEKNNNEWNKQRKGESNNEIATRMVIIRESDSKKGRVEMK